jgi:hypothetical protein
VRGVGAVLRPGGRRIVTQDLSYTPMQNRMLRGKYTARTSRAARKRAIDEHESGLSTIRMLDWHLALHHHRVGCSTGLPTGLGAARARGR